MDKIIVLLNGELQQDLVLEKDFIQIGRSPENDIQLRDPHVSREHARLVREEKGYVIQDLESRNGTLLNNERIQRHLLEDGDVLRIGHFRLQYLRPEAETEVFRGTPAAATAATSESTDDHALSSDLPLDFSVGLDDAPGMDKQAGLGDTAGAGELPKEQEGHPGEGVSVAADHDQLLQFDTDDDFKPAVPEDAATPDSPQPSEHVGPTDSGFELELELEPEPEMSSASRPKTEPPAPGTDVLFGEPRVQHLNGDQEGTVEPFSKGMAQIGQPGEDIAVVMRRVNGYFVVRVGGHGVTAVNGEPVEERTQVRHGDLIQVGPLEVRFLCETSG
jgi:pSer/pThr/pTyr-binding forkhead associated (FHA) protein